MFSWMKRVLLVLLTGLIWQHAYAANSSVFCDNKVSLNADQKNRLLLFANTIKEVLNESGNQMALMSRSGIDLDRFNIRYSHSGISLKNSQNTPWSVRQLYYGCDEGRPSIYDQGLAGFVMDQSSTDVPYISLVFLPSYMEGGVQTSALDNKTALSLLGGDYSANAYAYSTKYQNCNQWLIEMLAHVWGALPAEINGRQSAQAWLKEQQYQPSDINVKYRFYIWASYFVPLIHTDDHPADNISNKDFMVSMPASIEGFVHTMVPGARRVELCLKDNTVIIHQGWELMKDNCVAGEGDKTVTLS